MIAPPTKSYWQVLQQPVLSPIFEDPLIIPKQQKSLTLDWNVQIKVVGYWFPALSCILIPCDRFINTLLLSFHPQHTSQWLSGKPGWCCWWRQIILYIINSSDLWLGHISSAIHLINSEQEFAQFTFSNIKLIFHCSSHVHTWSHVRGRLAILLENWFPPKYVKIRYF